MSIVLSRRGRFFAANSSIERIFIGADLAEQWRVAIPSRIRMLLRPMWAIWLIVLSASPFTAPFRTCDISMLFEGGTIPPKASLPASPVEAASRDASLQPSSVAVTTARLRFPALTAGSERWLVASPRVAGTAPSLLPPDEGAHESRLFVLRI